MNFSEVREDRDKITFVIPHFSYTDYDRSLKIPIDKLSHILEACQVFYGAISPLNQLDEWRLGAQNISILGCRHKLTRDFYQQLNLGSPETQMSLANKEIEFETRLAYMGRTFFDIRTEIRAEKGKKLLGVSDIKYVRLNDKGKVLKTPDTLKASDFWSLEQDAYLRFNKFPIKDASYVHKVCVPYSDLDSNDHVNHKGYFRYAMETATIASIKGRYEKLNKDFSKYALIEAEAYYLKDATATESLTIETWEDMDELSSYNFPKIRFLIRNNDGVDICYVSLAVID